MRAYTQIHVWRHVLSLWTIVVLDQYFSGSAQTTGYFSVSGTGTRVSTLNNQEHPDVSKYN